MRLTKHVYQLLGPMYGSHQNVYGIHTEKGMVLIDSGHTPQETEIIMNNLRKWILPRKIIAVFLTHAHVEHSGNAAYFQEEGAFIYASEHARSALEEGNDYTASYAFFGQAPFQTCRLTIPLYDGYTEMYDTCVIRAIETPGHSDDSMCYKVLVDDKEILFTGDTILVSRVCRLATMGWTGAIDYHPEKLMETYQKISTMYCDILLPGHGETCLYHGDRLLLNAYVQARLNLVNQPQKTIPCENLERSNPCK